MADILSLPILPFNELKISGTIEIFQILVTHLDLNAHILYDKKDMFKRDYMIVLNITWAIYYNQKELLYIYEFFWIKFNAGMFHLQINILKLFITTFWGQSKNVFSL